MRYLTEPALKREHINKQLFEQMDRYVNQHNERFKERGQGRYRINANVKDTLRYILSLYSIELFKLRRLANPPGAIPPLRTCSPGIAAKTGRSSRTIYNHLQRLIEAKALIKVWRGSNASYELYFNPQIVSVMEPILPGVMWKTANNDHLLMIESCPKSQFYVEKISTYSIKDTLYKEYITTVEKWKTTDSTSHTGQDSGENQRRASHQEFNFEWKHKKGNTPAVENTPTPIKPQTAQDNEGKETQKRGAAAGPETIPEYLLPYLEYFIAYAYHLLFDAAYLHPDKKKRLLQTIYPYYSTCTPESVKYIHSELLKRIHLVHQYLAYNPNKTLPDPEYYFRVTNKNGFTGSKRFYYAHRERKKYFEAENFVDRQVREYQKHIKVNGTESTYEVFKRGEQRVSKKFPKMLPVFYAKVGYNVFK